MGLARREEKEGESLTLLAAAAAAAQSKQARKHPPCPPPRSLARLERHAGKEVNRVTVKCADLDI